jgi:pimeloyl-ACP methyl ester carboxylesterase
MASSDASGYLTIDGRRLEYAWHGPAPDSAPTLVFLHEGLGCVDMWKDFPAGLAAATGCGALVYSRVGFGGSSPASLPRAHDYLHKEALDVLPRVLDAAGIREAVLIGHSDGASLAIVYAGGCTESRLRGIALMAAHVFVEDEPDLSCRSENTPKRRG